MIIVDDRLCLEALAGRLEGDDDGPVATTWSFHFRLVRAITDDSRVGRLTRATPADLQRAAVDPPSNRLLVLDPREVTRMAAAVARRHGLNLLAAELVASALHHRASLMLDESNVGRSWPSIFESENIRYTVRRARPHHRRT